MTGSLPLEKECEEVMSYLWKVIKQGPVKDMKGCLEGYGKEMKKSLEFVERLKTLLKIGNEYTSIQIQSDN